MMGREFWQNDGQQNDLREVSLIARAKRRIISAGNRDDAKRGLRNESNDCKEWQRAVHGANKRGWELEEATLKALHHFAVNNFAKI